MTARCTCHLYRLTVGATTRSTCRLDGHWWTILAYRTGAAK